MSYIQLPYGYVENNKQVQFNIPKNYEESFYLDKVTYLNAVVRHDENFTNAIVRHSLDLKDEAVFRNPNPLNITFHDMKKFDLVNPVIGKLPTQVKASKLTDYELTKKLLMKSEIDQLQNRLDKLKYGKNYSGGGDSGDGGDDGPGTTGSDLLTPQQKMDEITRRLDKLRGNKNELSPYNTPAQNSTIIVQQNNQKFLDRQINQREREIKNIPKGIVKNRRSSINFQLPQINSIKNYKLPDTLPQTPDDYWSDVAQNWVGSPDLPISGLPRSSSPPLFDYERDFPPLSKFVPQPPEPRETSFLFSNGSFSPLRNKLKHIVSLPNKPIVDNFSRPTPKMADDSNNSISIMPKRSNLESIGQKQLSEQLQQIFPDVDQTIQRESETFKERTRDLDEAIERLSKSKDTESFDQVTFEFEFFTGGQN